MITVVNGDLLKSDCDVIIHQANCFARMGAGIAKQIVGMYPGVKKLDREYKIPVGSLDRLGKYSAYTSSNGVTIVNMYSQYRWGREKRQTDYEAMKTALRNILQEVNGTKVGMPYMIGCGLAGGDWEIVYGIIEEVTTDLGKDVYLYKL